MYLASGGHQYGNVSFAYQEHENDISGKLQNFITALTIRPDT